MAPRGTLPEACAFGILQMMMFGATAFAIAPAAVVAKYAVAHGCCCLMRTCEFVAIESPDPECEMNEDTINQPNYDRSVAIRMVLSLVVAAAVVTVAAAAAVAATVRYEPSIDAASSLIAVGRKRNMRKYSRFSEMCSIIR